MDDARAVINTNQLAKEDGKIDEKEETSENPPGVVGKNMEIRRMSTTDEGDKVLRSAWDSPEKVSIASNCLNVAEICLIHFRQQRISESIGYFSGKAWLHPPRYGSQHCEEHSSQCTRTVEVS